MCISPHSHSRFQSLQALSHIYLSAPRAAMDERRELSYTQGNPAIMAMERYEGSSKETKISHTQGNPATSVINRYERANRETKNHSMLTAQCPGSLVILRGRGFKPLIGGLAAKHHRDSFTILLRLSR